MGIPTGVANDGVFEFYLILNQIKSFLLVYEAVKTTINDQGVVWVYGKGHKGVSFCVGRCVLREWVVGGGGLDGFFGE